MTLLPKADWPSPHTGLVRILLIQRLTWVYVGFREPHNGHSCDRDGSHGNSFIRHCSVCHVPRRESTSWHKCTAERWNTAYSRSSCETWAPNLLAYTSISERERNRRLMWFNLFRSGNARKDSLMRLLFSGTNDTMKQGFCVTYLRLTSTNTDPQTNMIQTAKKIFNGLGGSEGKTNELIMVTWNRKWEFSILPNQQY